MGRLEPAGEGGLAALISLGRGRSSHATQERCHSPGEGAPPPPQAPLPWILPSLFAAFNVVLLLVFSGLFFAFPWLAQNGEWAFPIITGPLFVLTFFSLVSLNFSDPGILHQGSGEQGPTAVHVIWVNRKAFRLQWCQKCGFHRPPRTHHCRFCNVCVEDFDHHCQWVNNCIGHRNFRLFMLLVLSLCLYSGAVLVTCLIFLLRTTQQTLYLDKVIAYPPACCARAGSRRERGDSRRGPGGGAMMGGGGGRLEREAAGKTNLGLGGGGWTREMGGLRNCMAGRILQGHGCGKLKLVRSIVVAVPAACFLVPLCLLLLIQAMSVSAAERSCEGQCRYLWGYNPFDQGCASNWYLAICAPLGPK
ncbi:hypothetical protein QTO34_014555 [Cnephaeus nilssonii]|uniref:Palmitoyltransferase n=1 Tax=Cnephaeus nilssonii TaxID=3371016 RepID=A0AA40LU54_CNENI|nr:hypothetical protein QTO34_014555 [Eptesicus nilssonii]